MSRVHFIVFASTIWLAGSSSAAPILLAELQVTDSHVDVIQSQPFPNEIRFSFGMGNELWTQTVTSASVGQTFSMPEPTLANFAAAWDFMTQVSHTNFVSFSATAPGIPGPGGPKLIDIAPFIPPQRTLLVGVERTINAVILDHTNPGRSIYGGTQTIRLFGEAIPEPATWLIALLAFSLPFLLRTCRDSKIVSGAP